MSPYFANFKPAVGGLGIVPLNSPRDMKEWILMWGAQLFILLSVGISYLILIKAKGLSIAKHIRTLIKENDRASLLK